MKFKDATISMQSLQPQLLLALVIVDQVMQSHRGEAIITSLNDAKHSYTSLHYSGCAADLRSYIFTDKDRVLSDCKIALGHTPDIDMILESDHFHIEYQPKYRG